MEDRFPSAGASTDLRDEEISTLANFSSTMENVCLKSYTFNQDASCFICSTSAGFRVYTCNPLYEFMRLETHHWPEGAVDVAAMLYRTNVFALVTTSECKKIKLWDDQKKQLIGELRSRQQIRNVCLGRDILAMVTEYTIYVYHCEQMRPFNVIHTGSNLRGVCVVTCGTDKDNWKIACPAVATGAVRIQSSAGERLSHVFQSHQAALTQLAFSPDGTLIATASETGTVIRVFATEDGQLLHELRRGAHKISISWLAFRQDNQFIAVASSSATIHIFSLSQTDSLQEQDSLAVSRRYSIASSSPCSPRTGATTSCYAANIATIDISDVPGLHGNATGSSLQQVTTCGKHGIGLDDISQYSRGAGNPLTANAQHPPTTGTDRLPAAVVVAYDTSKEMVHDALKGALPRYFGASRSVAQFHIPVDHQSIDVRWPLSPSGSLIPPQTSIVGPVCAFSGDQPNNLYVLHHNGVFYECRFDPACGGECVLLNATTWFAPRPDFRIQSHLGAEKLRSEMEDGREGDEWEVLM